MRRVAVLPCLLLPFVLGGCIDEEAPTEPTPAALFSCLFGDARHLEVGEVLRVQGEGALSLCLSPGDYLYVPFHASETGTANLQVELVGGGFRAPIGPPTPARAPIADLARPDERFHRRLRRREAEELAPLLASAARPARAPALASVPPVEGELVLLNTTAACDTIDLHTGRVEAVTRTAIVVSDVSNPAGGLEPQDYRAFGEAFDTLVNPVSVQNFGEPTDIDGNDRVIIFFTRAVNELTEPGSGVFVGGFFWAGDLFPKSACPGSNTAEMFYMLVPDPERAAAGERAFEPSFVRRIAVGILGHEYQHLINAGRRIYVNDAEEFEEVWLNEGLSHIAEELLFYAATGLQPRMNIDVETLRSSQHLLNAFNAYVISNFGRFLQYLENPDEETLFGIDELPTRGASWAFLRWAADHEAGPDADFFRALVNGREAGVANLAAVLPGDPIDEVQAWTVSVYTDDTPIPVQALYTMPSWNFRSIMPVLAETETYPLEVITPQPGRELSLTLRGGGAAYVRFGVDDPGRALLRTTSGGAIPRPALRISLVRTR